MRRTCEGGKAALIASVLAAVVLLAGAAAAQDSTPTSVPTTPPGAVQQAADHVQDYSHLGETVLIALLVALGVLLVPYVLYRIVKLGRTPQLVIGDIADTLGGDGVGDPTTWTDSSGSGSLSDQTTGLSQLLREELVDQLHKVGGKVEESINLAEFLARPLTQSPLDPRTSPDKSLTT